ISVTSSQSSSKTVEFSSIAIQIWFTPGRTSSVAHNLIRLGSKFLCDVEGLGCSEGNRRRCAADLFCPKPIIIRSQQINRSLSALKNDYNGSGRENAIGTLSIAGTTPG